MATSRTGTGKWKRVAAQRRYLAQQEGITHCPECAVQLDWHHSRTPTSPEVDHIIPYSVGGQDTIDNTRIICRKCNQSLGAKHYIKQKQRETDAQNALITTTTLVDW